MDKQEFQEKVLPVKDKIFRMSKMMLQSREEAEDILQDVMLGLWHKRGELNLYRSIEAFAMTMAKNKCLDKLRYGKNKIMHDVANVELESQTSSPYSFLENKDNGNLILKLVSLLPEQQKLIIHLKDVEDYTYEEIEEITGLSVNHIRVTVSRARKQIREHFLRAQNFKMIQKP